MRAARARRRRVDPLLTDTGAGAPAPTRAGLRAALDRGIRRPGARAGTGITRPRRRHRRRSCSGARRRDAPASRLDPKLLAALAVADGSTSTDADDDRGRRRARLAPTSCSSPAATPCSPPARGDPDAVAGRAGLADLAAQVAAALAPAGRTTRAPAPRPHLRPRAPLRRRRGTRHDVRDGFTQAVVMTGPGHPAAARPLHPSPLEPRARGRRRRSSTRLAAAGVTRDPAPRTHLVDARRRRAPRPLGSVESATYAEVLDLALDHSENALTENLTRQAAVASGRSTTRQGDNAAVHPRAAGAPRRADAPGWSSPTRAGSAPGSRPAAAILSATCWRWPPPARSPELRDVVAGLPVAGLSGTLTRPLPAPATAGRRRACPGQDRHPARRVSALAGTVVDADGRLLTYVAARRRVPAPAGNAARPGRVGPVRGRTDQVRVPLTAARARRQEPALAYVDWEFAKTTGRHARARRARRVTPGRGGGRGRRDPRPPPAPRASRWPRPPGCRRRRERARTPWSSTGPPGSRSTPTR